MSEYDIYFEKYIKFGQFAKIQIVQVMIIALMNGNSTITNGLLIPVLTREWSLSNNQQKYFFSSIIFYHFVASIFSGKISDNHGRKTPLIFSTIGIFTTHILSQFAQNYTQFYCIRAISGFFFGINDNVLITYASEIQSTDKRSLLNVLHYVAWGLGQLFQVCLAMIIFSDVQTGNWRLMIQISSFIFAIVCVIVYRGLLESPRYLLQKQLYEEGFAILDLMGQKNDEKYINIDHSQKQKIIQSIQQQQQNQGEIRASIKALFNDQRRLKMVTVIILRIAVCFIQYLLLMILPTIVMQQKNEENHEESGKSYSQFFFLMIFPFGQIIGGFISKLFIDSEYFGRKNTLIYSCLFGSLICFILALDLFNFSFMILIITLTQQIQTVTVSVMTSEIFETSIRATAQGFGRAASRLVTILMPIFSYQLLQYGATKPFLLIIPLYISSAFIVQKCLIETRGIHLDSYQDLENKNKNNLEMKLLQKLNQ